MVGTLGKIGAFDEKTWLCTCALGQGSDAVDAAGNCTHTDCPPDVCGTHNGIAESVYECEGGNPTTTIDGTTMTGTCEYASCDWTAGCHGACVATGANFYGGGMMSCTEDCTSTMAGGAGSWGGATWLINLEQSIINASQCTAAEGGQWDFDGNSYNWNCPLVEEGYKEVINQCAGCTPDYNIGQCVNGATNTICPGHCCGWQ